MNKIYYTVNKVYYTVNKIYYTVNKVYYTGTYKMSRMVIINYITEREKGNSFF